MGCCICSSSKSTDTPTHTFIVQSWLLALLSFAWVEVLRTVCVIKTGQPCAKSPAALFVVIWRAIATWKVLRTLDQIADHFGTARVKLILTGQRPPHIWRGLILAQPITIILDQLFWLLLIVYQVFVVALEAALRGSQIFFFILLQWLMIAWVVKCCLTVRICALEKLSQGAHTFKVRNKNDENWSIDTYEARKDQIYQDEVVDDGNIARGRILNLVNLNWIEGQLANVRHNEGEVYDLDALNLRTVNSLLALFQKHKREKSDYREPN